MENQQTLIAVKELLTDPYFWLGQIGLGLTIICGFTVNVLANNQEPRPRVYFYTIPIFAVVVSAAYVFAEPFINPQIIPLSDSSYLFRLAVGIMFGGVTQHYRYMRKGSSTSIEFTKRLNRGVLIGVCIMIALMAVIGLRLALEKSQDMQVRYMELEGRKYQVDPRIIAELSRLTALHERDQSEIRGLKLRVATQQASQERLEKAFNQATKENRTLILSLKSQIQQLSVRTSLQR